MQVAVQTSTAPLRFVPDATNAVQPLRAPAAPDCTHCHMRELCLPAGLADADVLQLDGMKFARRRVKAGEPLYHAGDKFGFVYAVRSGTFKTVVMHRDGREQVTGFQVAGDVMGLDGVANGVHATTVIPLEDAEICAIPYQQLVGLAVRHPSLLGAVRRLMSRELVREHHVMLLLASMHAEERLASFLLNISERMRSRGYSASEFHLRMSRAEIGSYLGMKLETVSRTFSAFQQQGLLKVDKKHVRILDLPGLARLCETTMQ
jgi:CRP/FNR family transcriptional regulator